MSAPATQQEALGRVIEGVIKAAEETIKSPNAATFFASNPATRHQVEDLQRIFRQWIQRLKNITRKLERAEAIVSKALRRNKPGLRA